MNTSEQQYLNGLKYILETGEDVLNDRTGIGRKKVSGYQMNFDLQEGFPILTTKKIPFKTMAKELLWFLSGDTNIETLVHSGVKIWNEWPAKKWMKANNIAITHKLGTREYQDEWNQHLEEFVEKIRTDHSFAQQWGELGPVYGKQWRNFGATRNPDGTYKSDGVDQISKAIEMIKNDPTSTRIIVTGWDPREVELVDLPPCHTFFKFTVINGKLYCHMWMRSADAFLGVPFNIASYALLTHMMAQVTNLIPHKLTISFDDFHIYLNHLNQVKEQLTRTPAEMPTLQLNHAIKSIFDFSIQDINLINYSPQETIKADIAV